MSTKQPTAAESAQWHRGTAYMYRRAARRYQDGNVTPTENVAERVAAHHEAAAEALDLLAEIAKARMDRTTAWAVTHNGAPPNGVALNLPSELAARIVALVEGK